MSGTQTVDRRRKRLHVPEENRKRIARACDVCRKVKEKCQGGIPCSRCVRLRRVCTFVRADEPTTLAKADAVANDVFPSAGDVEQLEAMKEIIKHYTGCLALDKPTLLHIASSIRKSSSEGQNGSVEQEKVLSGAVPSHRGDEYSIDPVSSTTAVYTGEFSHCHFSNVVQHDVNELLARCNAERIQSVLPSSELDRASRLYTKPETTTLATTAFPPHDVVKYLFDVFVRYAQTNYYYIDERSLREKIDGHLANPQRLGACDAPWVCTALMVMAVATQFAHLTAPSSKADRGDTNRLQAQLSSSLDDSIALTLYQTATTLIHDVITTASIESVQAFLLLGVYTLPLDAAGLSYTYTSLAIKMAILNGMHRKKCRGMNGHTMEIRNRIWWTVYTLEKRICVQHGRPVSVTKLDVDTDLPTDLVKLRPTDSTDILHNVIAMIRLTAILEDARTKLSWARRAPVKLQATIFTSILRMKQDLYEFWQKLPAITYCRDLDPAGPLFRPNVHLALTYHLVHSFIGRNFLFNGPGRDIMCTTDDIGDTECDKVRTTLVANCIESAITTVDLCQMLEDNVGLSRASYTEFTSCRAALLVLLARRTRDKSMRVREVIAQGLELLRQMSLGLYVADAEKSSIEAMAKAVQYLDHMDNGQQEDSTDSSEFDYNRFRDWAMLWSNDNKADAFSMDTSGFAATAEQPCRLDADGTSGSNPFEISDWDILFPSFPFESSDFEPPA